MHHQYFASIIECVFLCSLNLVSATPHVTCARVSCEHQCGARRIVGHVAGYGHNSAGLWVEEELWWHCHGVPAAQQHVAVSVWPYEACDQITMKGPTDTQGPIRTWSEREENDH